MYHDELNSTPAVRLPTLLTITEFLMMRVKGTVVDVKRTIKSQFHYTLSRNEPVLTKSFACSAPYAED